MDPLPRGMPGEVSGDVCPMRGGTPGRPCRCCQLGAGLLMSVRARDQQVGLGCSCWREAWDGDPTGQGSGREYGSGGGEERGGALGFSPAALWEEVNKRKYLWGEWGHDQGVGSGAVLPAAATGGSQALHTPLQQAVWRQFPSYCPFLCPASHGEPSFASEGYRGSEESGQGA